MASQPVRNTGFEPVIVAPRKEKLQQKIEEICAATVRAWSGEKGFEYRGRQPEVNGRPAGIRAPHLRTDPNEDDFTSCRGAADGIALRLKHSDVHLHRRLMPESPVGQMIFELLEQLRVEKLVEQCYPGMAKNLDHRYKQWCAQFCASDMIESHVGLLVYTIAQVAWSRLSGQPVNEATEGLIEPQRMMLAPHIGTFLVGLKRNVHHQPSYAEHALGIVQVIDEIATKLDKPEDDNKDRDQKTINSFGLYFDEDFEGHGDTPALPGRRNNRIEYRELVAQLAGYKVYSRANDRVISAEKLVASFQRQKLRLKLDQRIKGQGVNVHRLARELQQILSAPERDGWNFGEEEGYIDARRLSRLVTSPDYRQLFRQERYQPRSHCLVTFLVDNSGSMKEHIASIATLIEIMTRALEQAGARSEILGFTTRSWQGGKLFKQWRGRAGHEAPGRLAELQHIIYKDADTPMKRARNHIAAMLKQDIFKEGIDGEALLWAAERMNNRTEERRILIVLSDGCPMEAATAQSNDDDFLDNHLRQVARMIEARGDIELYALGFGLDLSTYYRNSLELDLPEVLENRVFKEIIQMLRKRR